jgi:hypothetical protein
MFASASCFAYSLFNGSLWASLPIGVFWGAMVVNMYLLLLHTISPSIIPLASKKKLKKKIDDTKETKSYFALFSMFLRLSFMMLLAIIIAQPLNVYLLKSSVSISLEKHKLQERVKLYTTTNQSLINNELNFHKDFNRKIKAKLTFNTDGAINSQINLINSKIIGDSIFLQKASQAIQQLKNLNNHWSLTSEEKKQQENLLDSLNTLLQNELLSDVEFITNLENLNIPLSITKEFDEFRASIIPLINDKTANYDALNTLLNKSNFYVKTIQLLLLENPFSWMVTLFICMVFLIPIGLKYYARNISAKMFLENNKDDSQLIRLRQELISTTDFKWLKNTIIKIDVR